MNGGHEPVAEAIGQRLRRLRLERGLTQRALAEPGVSGVYISRIEAGARQPSVTVVRMLAQRLGVSADYLETGIDLQTEQRQRELRLADAELELRLADDPTDVEQRLRGILEEAIAAGDETASVTRAHAALGLAAFRRGDHAEALALLEQAVSSGSVSALTDPDLYGTLGRCYVSSGQTAEAVVLFERCLEEIGRDAPESDAAYVRFATYLSYALSDMGELGRARAVLSEALGRVDDAIDPYARVRLYWSQARLEAAEGDPEHAIADLRRAIAVLEATEDTRQLARAHLLYGEILTFEGEAEQSRSHLVLAERLLGVHPDAEDVYWLRTEQARCAAQLGDADEAIVRASEALELIGDTDPAERGAASWALGDALFLKGELEAADEALSAAVELLASQRLWREAAKAARSWARLLRALGREAEAFDVLEQAANYAANSATVTTVILR